MEYPVVGWIKSIQPRGPNTCGAWKIRVFFRLQRWSISMSSHFSLFFFQSHYCKKNESLTGRNKSVLLVLTQPMAKWLTFKLFVGYIICCPCRVGTVNSRLKQSVLEPQFWGYIFHSQNETFQLLKFHAPYMTWGDPGRPLQIPRGSDYLLAEKKIFL